MDARPRSLADDQVNAVVLHRRIEDLFDGWHQAMDLVEEKDLAGLERGEDGGQIALALEQRPGAGLDGHTQFVREDLRERRLTQARRPVEQDVVECLATAARRLDGNGNVLLPP